MLPADYISRVPEPQGSVDDIGLHFPWQTPSRWTYPITAHDQDERIPRDPNDHTGGLPDIADEECLKRTNIPWKKKGGTKVYLKVNSIIKCFLI